MKTRKSIQKKSFLKLRQASFTNLTYIMLTCSRLSISSLISFFSKGTTAIGSNSNVISGSPYYNTKSWVILMVNFKTYTCLHLTHTACDFACCAVVLYVNKQSYVYASSLILHYTFAENVYVPVLSILHYCQTWLSFSNKDMCKACLSMHICN